MMNVTASYSGSRIFTNGLHAEGARSGRRPDALGERGRDRRGSTGGSGRAGARRASCRAARRGAAVPRRRTRSTTGRTGSADRAAVRSAAGRAGSAARAARAITGRPPGLRRELLRWPVTARSGPGPAPGPAPRQARPSWRGAARREGAHDDAAADRQPVQPGAPSGAAAGAAPGCARRPDRRPGTRRNRRGRACAAAAGSGRQRRRGAQQAARTGRGGRRRTVAVNSARWRSRAVAGSTSLRPRAGRGPWGGERRGSSGRRACACAGESRGSWPGDGCSAGKCACSLGGSWHSVLRAYGRSGVACSGSCRQKLDAQTLCRAWRRTGNGCSSNISGRGRSEPWKPQRSPHPCDRSLSRAQWTTWMQARSTEPSATRPSHGTGAAAGAVKPARQRDASRARSRQRGHTAQCSGPARPGSPMGRPLSCRADGDAVTRHARPDKKCPARCGQPLAARPTGLLASPVVGRLPHPSRARSASLRAAPR